MKTLTSDEVIALCERRGKDAAKAVHLNVRLSKDDATIYEQLCAMTPKLTASQRIKDSVRVSTFLLASDSPIIKKLGAFTA